MVHASDINLDESDLDLMMEQIGEDILADVRARAREIMEIKNGKDASLMAFDFQTSVEERIENWAESRREEIANDQPDHYTHGETA